ncbi:MAG: DUF1573 domain-containing protein [Pirellula sp.]
MVDWIRRVGIWMSQALLLAPCSLLLAQQRAELPPWVPKDAEEIKNDSLLLVSRGIDAEEIKLGTLLTGKKYFAIIKFVNMHDSADRIVEMKSSCGCMAGYRSDEEIPPKGKGFFVAALEPHTKAETFGKTLTIITKAGISVKVLLTAKFVSAFNLSQDRIVVNRSISNISLKLRPTEGFEVPSTVGVKSITGFTSVAKFDKQGAKNEWELELVPSEATHSMIGVSRVLVESLMVFDLETKKPICELVCNLEDSNRFACKPSSLQVSKTDDKWRGQFLLLGCSATTRFPL